MMCFAILEVVFNVWVVFFLNIKQIKKLHKVAEN